LHVPHHRPQQRRHHHHPRTDTVATRSECISSGRRPPEQRRRRYRRIAHVTPRVAAHLRACRRCNRCRLDARPCGASTQAVDAHALPAQVVHTPWLSQQSSDLQRSAAGAAPTAPRSVTVNGHPALCRLALVTTTRNEATTTTWATQQAWAPASEQVEPWRVATRCKRDWISAQQVDTPCGILRRGCSGARRTNECGRHASDGSGEAGGQQVCRAGWQCTSTA